MRYKLRFTSDAVKDIERHKKSGDKKLLQKIEILLEELIMHPKTGTGQPEKLKYNWIKPKSCGLASILSFCSC